jgi:hypothetical protein
MLLWTRLHLRADVRMPHFVWLQGASRAAAELRNLDSPNMSKPVDPGMSRRARVAWAMPSWQDGAAMSADFAPAVAAAARARGLLRAGQRLARYVSLLMLLLLPLQASGLVHLVVDATRTLAGVSLHGDAAPCPHEEDGERCPPDCPDCHCTPAVPALLPVMPSVLIRGLAFNASQGQSPAASLSPRPLVHGLERPPRIVRSFA